MPYISFFTVIISKRTKRSAFQDITASFTGAWRVTATCHQMCPRQVPCLLNISSKDIPPESQGCFFKISKKYSRRMKTHLSEEPDSISAQHLGGVNMAPEIAREPEPVLQTD